MTGFPRIYFAGVNTVLFCHAFAGLRVLESFADVVGVVERHRPNFKSMCLDSGAYSEMTTGRKVDLGAYIDFCHRHGQFYDFIASLDAIVGGQEVSLRNWERMLGEGVHAVPTFHQGESFEALDEYVARAPMVGLGFQRPIAGAREWLDQCFSRIPGNVRVHGWGMTNYTDYPFWSVDSTTWLREFLDIKAYRGQGAAAIQCLTELEIIEIVQKRYLRLPKRERWGTSDPSEPTSDQFALDLESR